MTFKNVSHALGNIQLSQTYPSIIEWEKALEISGYVHTMVMHERDPIGDFDIRRKPFGEVVEMLKEAFRDREMSDWTCYFHDVIFKIRFTDYRDAVYAKLILG